jgi:hypothetical protein
MGISRPDVQPMIFVFIRNKAVVSGYSFGVMNGRQQPGLLTQVSGIVGILVEAVKNKHLANARKEMTGGSWETWMRKLHG